MEEQKLSIITKLSSFTKQCVRVWYLLKKPDKKEFITVSKISAIGLSLIGVIGFTIAVIMSFFRI
ncbi:MAG: protein translocase SEC61 complex subunit gamma [Candidatus Pacearchaeota archaeon]